MSGAGVHLSCPCGATYDNDDLSVADGSDVIQAWVETHDGFICRIEAKAKEFLDKLRNLGR